MKVRNLYIGNIYMVSKVDYFDDGYGDTEVKRIGNFSRKTVCYHLSNHSKKIKDICYGGRYQIGADNLKVGNYFAADFSTFLPILIQMGYMKKNITKRKFKKLIKTKSREIQIQSEE